MLSFNILSREILFYETFGIGEIFQNMVNVAMFGYSYNSLSQMTLGRVENDFHPQRINLY